MTNKDYATLSDGNGSWLCASTDSNRDYPDYLSWAVVPGSAFGVMQNTPRTRQFLDNVLRRFRRDASRLKQRAKKKGIADVHTN